MTSHPLYMKPHPVRTATYTLYKRHHSPYLCPHTQSIDNITPTLCMTSNSPYVWHLLPYTNHHILIFWHQTFMFMSSQPLYLTSCPLCVDGSSHPLYWWYDKNCISEITSAIVHNIISIVYDMTPTVSHHNHCSWHQIPYISHHLQDLWHIVPYSCDITDTMFVNTCNCI